MQTEVTKVPLWTKIHKAKMSIGKVVKNSTNPHFKKSYADINALLETVEPSTKGVDRKAPKCSIHH